jgi:FkbM family methyltransferase
MTVSMALKRKLSLTSINNKLKYAKFISNYIRKSRGLIGLKSRVLDIKRNGLYWNLDLREAIDFCLYISGEYEPQLLKTYSKLIKRNSIILEVGANIGVHTLPMANLLTGPGQVHAFEPTNFAIKKLKANLELNPTLEKKVSIHKVFISQNKQSILPELLSSSWDLEKPLHHRQRNPQDKGFSHSTIGAKSNSIDSWCEQEKLDKVCIIKVDVDGYEVDVLKGSIKTIHKFKPTLLLELAPINFQKNKDSFKDYIDLLNNLNYRFKDLFGNDVPMDATYLQGLLTNETLIHVIGNSR